MGLAADQSATTSGMVGRKTGDHPSSAFWGTKRQAILTTIFIDSTQSIRSHLVDPTPAIQLGKLRGAGQTKNPNRLFVRKKGRNDTAQKSPQWRLLPRNSCSWPSRYHSLCSASSPDGHPRQSCPPAQPRQYTKPSDRTRFASTRIKRLASGRTPCTRRAGRPTWSSLRASTASRSCCPRRQRGPSLDWRIALSTVSG